MAEAVTGAWIDMDFPAVQDYIFGKTGSSTIDTVPPAMKPKKDGPDGRAKPTHTTGTKLKAQREREASTPETRIEIPDNLKQFAAWSLEDLCNTFGSDVGFKVWLQAVDIIEKINAARLKNGEKDKMLVNRDLMRAGMVNPLDTCFSRLLMDFPKTVSGDAMDMVNSGADRRDVEVFLRQAMEPFLNGVKESMEKCLMQAVS